MRTEPKAYVGIGAARSGRIGAPRFCRLRRLLRACRSRGPRRTRSARRCADPVDAALASGPASLQDATSLADDCRGKLRPPPTLANTVLAVDSGRTNRNALGLAFVTASVASTRHTDLALEVGTFGSIWKLVMDWSPRRRAELASTSTNFESFAAGWGHDWQAAQRDAHSYGAVTVAVKHAQAAAIEKAAFAGLGVAIR